MQISQAFCIKRILSTAQSKDVIRYLELIAKNKEIDSLKLSAQYISPEHHSCHREGYTPMIGRSIGLMDTKLLTFDTRAEAINLAKMFIEDCIKSSKGKCQESDLQIKLDGFNLKLDIEFKD